ncbi:MAG: endonuclease III [Gammaproteobacteria bacterium]|nr:MAG: endonuclease III [Gammaproteobacteria bacterium]
MNKDKRSEIFRRLKEANPAPKTELVHKSTFELLISVILSAQATDVGVNKATKELYKVADTPQKILSLGESGLKKYIKSIGLYNSKAKNIIKTCKILIDEHNCIIPDDRESLQKLPGVGRKTANVVLNNAFGQPTIAVDTHIFRVSNRTGIAPGKDVLKVELKLEKFVPEEYKLHAHHWLILHGRYTCVARTPKCSVCSIIDLCEYRQKTIAKKSVN